MEVTASTTAAHRQARARDEQHLPRLDAGRDLDLVLAAAESGDAHGDRRAAPSSAGRSDARVERASVAHEERVRRDLHLHVEVAGRCTLPAGLTLAALRDAVAVLEPRRDLDLELTTLHPATLAPAVAARVGDAASESTTRVAGAAVAIRAERGAHHALHATRPAAAVPQRTVRHRPRTRAGAGPAGVATSTVHAPRHAGEDLLEGELDADEHVASDTLTLRRSTEAATPPPKPAPKNASMTSPMPPPNPNGSRTHPHRACVVPSSPKRS
jgi:hypothetical protein